MKLSHLFILLISALSTTIGHTALAQDSQPSDCQECHAHPITSSGATVGGSPYDVLKKSIHSSLDCTDCHTSLSMDDLDRDKKNPHGLGPHLVNCGECHEDEAATYVKHGEKLVGKNADIPKCWDCHGRHDILPAGDLHSHVNPSNLAKTCTHCHLNLNLIKKYSVLEDEPIKLYNSSVHGKASRMGLYAAANCASCHSANGKDGMPTAHRIFGPADPESSINHFNTPNTCGRCHKSIAADYWDGIHGQLAKRGEVDAPICTTCHGEHGIIAPSDPRSPVSPAHLAEQTCSPCHDSVVLNEKYGIPSGRLKTYIDSYHGLKSKAGNVQVANCASCHGAHRILPPTDPSSSIYPGNLQKTCGQCHPHISPELAQAGIHTTATGIDVGWPEFIRKFYIILIVIVIGLMLIHNIADWLRAIKLMKKKTFVLRLTVSETVQHWILAISFIVLAISGFALRFSESWWVQLIFGWGDGAGFLLRGTIHRIAAVVFIFVAIWHIAYLFTRRGRSMLREMIAGRRDLVNIKESVFYYLGRRDQPPRFGTFTYMEKCEYWALAWGAAIMIVTGLLLWFDNYFIERWHLPKGVLDVMLVIHHYEAWLATLAILVWHIYGTVFRPSVYPMNPAWLDGRMPKDMYDEEHPEGPRLKGRTYRAYYEEEEGPEDEENTAPDTPDPAPTPTRAPPQPPKDTGQH